MILLVSYGGGHVAALAPIAKALQEAGRPFRFLAMTTAAAHLQRLRIPCLGFADLPGATDDEVLRYGETLADELPPGGPVSRAESVAYLGLSFADLVHRLGAAEAASRYRDRGRQAFLPVRLMRAVIDAWQCRLVVATNSPRAERAAIAAAGSAGIRSLCLVDSFAMQEVEWIGVPGFADRVCVLNEQVREMFLARGRRAEEVWVTGNPAFDGLLSSQTIDAGERLREQRGWDDGLVTILWASQIEPEQHTFRPERIGDPSLPRRVEQYLRSFVVDHPGFRLVVRYHPSERETFVSQPRVEPSERSEDLGALLHAVDVVVVTASTVGMQASMIGRPVVSVDTSVFTADAPYSRMGISVGVDSVQALGSELTKIATRPQVASRRRADRVSAPVPATERVMRVLDSLCA